MTASHWRQKISPSSFHTREELCWWLLLGKLQRHDDMNRGENKIGGIKENWVPFSIHSPPSPSPPLPYHYQKSDETCNRSGVCLFFRFFSHFMLAQLATVWSTADTCTVCGHPTMSNYFTIYKIGVVAVLAFTYHSGYHCYYLSNYKLGVHMYCLWPPPPPRGESMDNCLSLEAETIFFGLLSYIVGLAVPIAHS